MAEEGSGMSKSAKRRAAKKARDAAGADDVAEEAPAPAPAPATEVKKEEPAPKAKAKAKPKAEPAPPPAEEPKPKGKAKAKAKAEPQAAEEPKPAAKAEAKPKADAKKKADGKAAAKPKAQPKKEEFEPPARKEEPPAEKKNDFSYTFDDDGKGGDWEMSSGKSKKQERIQRKQEERKAEQAAMIKTVGGKVVPGAMNTVPGMAGHQAGPMVDQSLMATPEQIAKIMATKAAPVEEKPKELTSVAEIKVPDEKLGWVIGPKGSKINMIKEKTAVNNISIDANMVRIEGKPDAVAQAQAAIQELIDKGFTSLSYENFKNEVIKVPTSSLPDLIGKEGCVIKAIKEALNVEVTMPKTAGPPGSGPKKTLVTVAGKADNVDKAKEVVSDITMYYHHEITHPGLVHEELEIEEWNYRFIIGKAGSELRHIEKNYKTRVRIPRDDTLNRNVVVVGEKRDVERARDYIYNAIAKANEPRGRGASDKAEDFWGEEDDVSGDPELARYLYKRS